MTVDEQSTLSSSSTRAKEDGEADNNNNLSSSSTASASLDLDRGGDIENQNPQSLDADAAVVAADGNTNDAGERGTTNGSVVSFSIVTKMKRASMNAKAGILALRDDEVVVDDEKNGAVTATPAAATKAPVRAYIPFPSIDELSMHNKKWDFDDANDHEFDDSTNQLHSKGNICPCRCFFFTLMETVCLVMSLLGCAVFLAGLVALCLFLEGSYVNGDE